jgi:photosystem II stability/assembly factor-like uncharacterized protein
MAWAAHCAGCGQSVYLTQDGKCPQGHGPELLGTPYQVGDASPSAPVATAAPKGGRGHTPIIVGIVLVLLVLCACGGIALFLTSFGDTGGPIPGSSSSSEGKWTALPDLANLNPGTVCFVDANTGWVIGLDMSGELDRDAVLRSTDGGGTWVKQDFGNGNKVEQACGWFLDVNTGWVVGAGSAIFATKDGGATWSKQKSPRDTVFTGVHFADANRGWVVGYYGTILATTDGGATWKEQMHDENMPLTGVQFLDANTGWAVGEDQKSGTSPILHTTDGGASWKRQSLPVKASLTDVHFIDANNGWTVGDDGLIFATKDGGRTWTQQRSGLNGKLWSVWFTDANNGWAVGGNRAIPMRGVMLRTTDGGATWKSVSVEDKGPVYSVQFVDPSHGWAVGDGGAILKYSAR